MENKIEKIEEILLKAETDLQQVIVEAAMVGDYRSIDAARAVAVSIHDLTARISNGTLASKTLKPQVKQSDEIAKGKRKSSRRKGGLKNYPKFELRKGYLVKIGWSKKQRCEYSHKVPDTIYDKTVEALISLSQSGTGPFMVEQIIEKVSASETETIPAYQIYVVIALLRSANCIGQIGKEGYSIPLDLSEKASKVWESLSSRKSLK
jgi:hypothetical protein